MAEHIVKSCSCPNCGKELDAADNTNNRDRLRPKPLDFSICIKCYQYLRYKEDMTLRKATVFECTKEGVLTEMNELKKNLKLSKKIVDGDLNSTNN